MIILVFILTMAENYVNINNKVSFLLCFEVIKYGRVL